MLSMIVNGKRVWTDLSVEEHEEDALTMMVNGQRVPTELLLVRLDHFTPAGKAILDRLPAHSERRTLIMLMKAGSLIRLSELTEEVRRDSRIVSMALTRLKERGLARQTKRGLWECPDVWLTLWYRFRNGVPIIDSRVPSDIRLNYIWGTYRRETRRREIELMQEVGF